MSINTEKSFGSLGHIPVENKNFLVKELAELWFIYIQNTMKPSSYARYRSYADKYIIPYIGDMDAKNFNIDNLSGLFGFLLSEDCIEGPVSKYTASILESMVRSMFRYGAENKLISEVYFGKNRYMSTEKKDVIPLPELEIQQLIHVLEGQKLDIQIQVMLPLYAGLSLSELCGLKWEDIDLENGKIHVHRNLMRIQNNTKNLNNSTATVITECELPENECREFIMPERLVFLLKTMVYKRKMPQERYVAELEKRTGRGRKPLGLAVTGNNRLIPPDGRTLQYRLKSVGRQAGLPNLTFQPLRDTFVVMCIQAGGDIYSIAYVLGTGITAIYERYKPWLIKKDGFLKEIK